MASISHSHTSLKTERLRLLLLAVISLLLVAGALYLQFAKQQDPCPLCILQRYAYLAIALFALVGATSRTWAVVTAVECLVLAAAAMGAALAARHVWIQLNPAADCGIDVLEPLVDNLPPAKWLPSVFRVAGLCETPYPPIAGLTLPQWSLVAYVLIVVSVGLSLLRRRLGRHGH